MKNAPNTPADESTVVWPLADLSALPDHTLARLLMRCAEALRSRGMNVEVTSPVETPEDAAGAAKMCRSLMHVRGLDS